MINHKKYPGFIKLGNGMSDSIVKLKQMERLELRLNIIIILIIIYIVSGLIV